MFCKTKRKKALKLEKQATQKKFKAPQLWVATHALGTTGIDYLEKNLLVSTLIVV